MVTCQLKLNANTAKRFLALSQLDKNPLNSALLNAGLIGEKSILSVKLTLGGLLTKFVKSTVNIAVTYFSKVLRLLVHSLNRSFAPWSAGKSDKFTLAVNNAGTGLAAGKSAVTSTQNGQEMLSVEIKQLAKNAVPLILSCTRTILNRIRIILSYGLIKKTGLPFVASATGIYIL